MMLVLHAGCEAIAANEAPTTATFAACAIVTMPDRSNRENSDLLKQINDSPDRNQRSSNRDDPELPNPP